MDYAILTLALVGAVGYWLWKREDWNFEHVLSLCIGVLWGFFFFTYGSKILVDYWQGANAADFFIIYFIASWGGMALISSIPFIQQKNYKKTTHLVITFLALGLIYTAVDNFTLGPAAVGKNSPYIGQDICKLNATYYAEDVFAGCYLAQHFGIDPYGEQAAFIVYTVFTLALFGLGAYLLGSKRVERMIYGR